MKVTVKAGWASRWTGGPEVAVESECPVTAREAAIKAGIPPDEIGMVAVNGKKTDDNTVLAEGAVLQVYPVIIGG